MGWDIQMLTMILVDFNMISMTGECNISKQSKLNSRKRKTNCAICIHKVEMLPVRKHTLFGNILLLHLISSSFRAKETKTYLHTQHS